MCKHYTWGFGLFMLLVSNPQLITLLQYAPPIGELTEKSIIHLKSLLVWIAFLNHKVILHYFDAIFG